ncbi:MAG TPA: inositol monophosphatase family protein [Candidatus Paceibacterota bacterium]|nr:inositol monophosphatase family protein [Verrucomicrobiota bacterium]HRY48845.1 inositol monophosphatase family protein [Candidatus Paceibacterota bacterium]
MGNTRTPQSESFKPCHALAVAVEAAETAGRLLRQHWRTPKKINESQAHDLKLELDVRCQRQITRRLRQAFPEIALLGEEGTAGDDTAPLRWVVDPIDGTVNYAYQIPHACVSIALQHRKVPLQPGKTSAPYQTLAGVVHDPFCQETWSAVRGHPARLNNRIIHVSARSRLSEAVVSVGFAKYDANLRHMLPGFQNLVPRARKVRIMGSAALDLVYVACGRMDAYVEAGVRLWDIAAGGLILECAGGDFFHRPLSGDLCYYVLANNGRLRGCLQRLCGSPSSNNNS